MTAPKPFSIEIPSSKIDAIIAKVRAYDWDTLPVMEEGGDPWECGTDVNYLKELCAYWIDEFDWRKAEALLNSYPQFKTNVDGYELHFLHVKGSGSNPETVILTHGWPGSIFEFYGVIDRLAHPEQFGGNAEDGLNLIIPSLPGYGFSGGITRPIGPRGTAALWEKLVRDALGYENYIAQGGDWGSAVSGWIAHDHNIGNGGGCKALHYNMYGVYAPVRPESDEEKAWAKNAERIRKKEFGYFHLQSTKPQTLSFGLIESPVGIAAWILEKLHRWSDRRGDDGSEHIENVFSKDQILTNIMIYLVTGTFGTSTWFYRGFRDERGSFFKPGTMIDVPTGIAVFPKELVPFPPRSMVQKAYNVVRWTEFEHGGHFAAMETGKVFADEVHAFIRGLKPKA